MVFLLSAALITYLQFYHRRFLRQVLPFKVKGYVTPALLVIHLPLAIYMALRLFGFATHPFGRFLRPFANIGLYFQALTAVNFATWVIGSAAWALRRWMKEGRLPLHPTRKSFLKKSAAGGMALLAAFGGAGAYQAQRPPQVIQHEIYLEALPQALDGLRIAHLSDMHAGPLVGEGQMRKWRELLDAQKPDLVLFTGDFVDSLPMEINAFAKAFKDYRAPLGCYAVLGNHDYFSDPRPIWNALKEMGIHCLENDFASVEQNGARFTIFGLQDAMALNVRFQGIRFGPGPQPDRLKNKLPPGEFRIGLIHRPGDWIFARSAGAHLTLAGHTHGGQINLIPGYSTAKLLTDYTQGLYTVDGRALYVSQGLGVVGLPMRLFAPAELPILTLRKRPIPTLQPPKPVAD